MTKEALHPAIRRSRPFPASADLIAAFVRNLSHEVRTPLTAIVGNAELLLDDLPEEDWNNRARAENIIRSSMALDRRLRAILDLSRFETDCFDLAPRTFEFVPLLEQEIAFVAPEAARKSITINADITDRKLRVTIDEYCLRHSLRQVLDNAIKFTEAGRVVVRTYRACPDCRIDIEDTGIGIASEYMPRLCALFSQQDSSLTRRFGGLGLGLALTERYLTINGARISAESTQGRGSTFTISLPCC